jgi:hypothetical protein
MSNNPIFLPDFKKIQEEAVAEPSETDPWEEITWFDRFMIYSVLILAGCVVIFVIYSLTFYPGPKHYGRGLFGGLTAFRFWRFQSNRMDFQRYLAKQRIKHREESIEKLRANPLYKKRNY